MPDEGLRKETETSRIERTSCCQYSGVSDLPSNNNNNNNNNIKEANHAGRYIPKNHSHSSPAGAESDSNPTAAAPSQTEVTDLNCSDHSIDHLKEMVAWRALVSIHLTRTQDPTPRYTMV